MRGSRRVLGERKGEVPLRHSTYRWDFIVNLVTPLVTAIVMYLDVMNSIKSIKLLSVILFLFLLPGCSYVIEVTIENNETLTPSFILKEKCVPIFGNAPKLREIVVCNKIGGKVDHSNPIWRITSDGIKTAKVTYGKIPKGFTEETKAQILVPQNTYYILALAWGSGGFTEFQIIKSGT